MFYMCWLAGIGEPEFRPIRQTFTNSDQPSQCVIYGMNMLRFLQIIKEMNYPLTPSYPSRLRYTPANLRMDDKLHSTENCGV